MSLIPEDIIAQVIERNDIVELISSYYPLKRAGQNFKTNCPFHNEKTPSFVVNPAKQIFHCFGCGVGGNVVSFVMKLERCEFPEAIRFLAQRVHIEIPKDPSQQHPDSNLRQRLFDINASALEYFHFKLLSGKEPEVRRARKYLKDRGVDLDTVKLFQLGYASSNWDDLLNYLKRKNVPLSLMEKAGLIVPRNKADGYYDRFRDRVMFPIFDTRRHCRAFGGRIIEGDGVKYINSPETLLYTKGHHLFGFHLAKDAILQHDAVVITEGYMDCLMPYQAGFQNIVAALGTALTVEQIRLIRRYTKNVIFLFDMDPAGEAAMMRSFDSLVEEGMHVKIAELKEGSDPDSYIREFGVESFRERIVRATELFDYKLKRLLNRHDGFTVNGVARISQHMLETIARFSSAVERSVYLRKLAGSLSIPEEALVTELNKLMRPKPGREPGKAVLTNVSLSEKIRHVEKNILKLLLTEDSFILSTREEIAASDFQDEKVRGVITKIFHWFDQGKKIEHSTFISSFEDAQVRSMITELMADDQIVWRDKQRVHQDCIQRIKQDRLKQTRRDLLKQIQEAEASGAHDRLNELKQQFNRLMKH